jgi:hypothetical protein
MGCLRTSGRSMATRLSGGSQIPHRPEQGLWFWTMTAVRPGPRVTFPTNGTEARRGDAGRRVVDAHERLLRRNA